MPKKLIPIEEQLAEVVTVIDDHGPMTIRDIAQRVSGISFMTVRRRVDDLLNDGSIEQFGLADDGQSKLYATFKNEGDRGFDVAGWNYTARFSDGTVQNTHRYYSHALKVDIFRADGSRHDWRYEFYNSLRDAEAAREYAEGWWKHRLGDGTRIEAEIVEMVAREQPTKMLVAEKPAESVETIEAPEQPTDIEAIIRRAVSEATALSERDVLAQYEETKARIARINQLQAMVIERDARITELEQWITNIKQSDHERVERENQLEEERRARRHQLEQQLADIRKLVGEVE
jgi:DNA-binding Lrp family transcriptional regulator